MSTPYVLLNLDTAFFVSIVVLGHVGVLCLGVLRTEYLMMIRYTTVQYALFQAQISRGQGWSVTSSSIHTSSCSVLPRIMTFSPVHSRASLVLMPTRNCCVLVK